MPVYHVEPDFNSGGVDQMRFVTADTPLAAVEIAASDIDDFERTFDVVEVKPTEDVNDYWSVRIIEPGKPNAVIPWDDMPVTYYEAKDA